MSPAAQGAQLLALPAAPLAVPEGQDRQVPLERYCPAAQLLAVHDPAMHCEELEHTAQGMPETPAHDPPYSAQHL